MASELVARDHEQREVLAAVRQGTGAVVRGEPGMGKTALAQAVADRLTRAGERVVWVVATAASQPMPYGALAPLLPDDLPALHPALVLNHVARELASAHDGRPALLVVDDAQFLDDQSAATILGLASTRGARLLVTLRSGATPPDAVEALWRDGFVSRIDVAPLDRAGAHALLVHGLGGEVAGATVELLWQRTRGNALYLCELIRYGRAEGRLRDVGGVWLWQGDLEVPPRLADLLERRFAGLSEAGLDALAALVLGEPLALDVLERIVPASAIAEVEGRRLVAESERGGAVFLGFDHPLLATAAEPHLTATRRRRIADALAATTASLGEALDVVRRARWQLMGGGPPDVGLLLDGARLVLLHRPALAVRLAERALARQPTVAATLLLSDARAEMGEIDRAREVLATAAALARDDDEHLAVHLGGVAFTAWPDRRPRAAIDRLAALRPTLPERFATDIDSTAALITLFAARPAAASALAEEVLRLQPARACAIRATTAQVGALALLDRPQEAAVATAALEALVATGPVSPYALGLAHAMMALARWTRWDGNQVPLTDPASARWPVPALSAWDSARTEQVAWPLLEGASRLIEGHVTIAVSHLREALAQQCAGEGEFRSEAVALLAVALAAAGQPHAAAAVLARDPPDELAVFPGLERWARSAVEAASGGGRAAELALEAAAEARDAGALVSVTAYLSDAARYGAARRAAAELADLGWEFRSPLAAARARGIEARATGEGKALLAAAEAHAAIGILGPALPLAELAAAALGRDASGARQRAQNLAGDLRRRLRLALPADQPVTPLTRRELEIARLAAAGTSDRDIAAALVVSVRTVESHLATVYRKLNIAGRRQLRDVIAPA